MTLPTGVGVARTCKRVEWLAPKGFGSKCGQCLVHEYSHSLAGSWRNASTVSPAEAAEAAFAGSPAGGGAGRRETPVTLSRWRRETQAAAAAVAGPQAAEPEDAGSGGDGDGGSVAGPAHWRGRLVMGDARHTVSPVVGDAVFCGCIGGDVSCFFGGGAGPVGGTGPVGIYCNSVIPNDLINYIINYKIYAS